MDFTPGQQKLLLYWGNIQAGVSQRVSTADLWASVRAAAEAEGSDLAGVSAVDMNQLRSIAAGQRNSLEAVARARPDQSLDASMIASDLSARPQVDQNLAPSWIVRFEHDVTIDGQLVTLWRSSVFDLSLPPTVGDLRSQVEQDAQELADKYGVTHVGIGRFQISAV